MNHQGDRPPVVLARLHDNFADDVEFIVEMYGLFVTDAGERLDSLDRALAEGDFRCVEDASHTLKGSGANIGAERMSDLAGQLEKADAENNPEAAQDLARELRSEFEAVETFVQSYIRSVH